MRKVLGIIRMFSLSRFGNHSLEIARMRFEDAKEKDKKVKIYLISYIF